MIKSAFPICRPRVRGRDQNGLGWPSDGKKFSIWSPKTGTSFHIDSLWLAPLGSAGYEVHVATRVVECAHQIENEGFALHPIAWQRGSINPLQMMAAAIAVRGLYRKLQPDIVHHVAFAPAIIGSLAALGLPMAKLNALAGLGFVFTSKTAKAQLLRLLAHHLLGCLCSGPALWCSCKILMMGPWSSGSASRRTALLSFPDLASISSC